MKAVTSPDRVVMAIREELAQTGRYHKDLASHLGITRQHLSMILNGHNRMTVDTMFRTLEYLDMPILIAPENRR